MSEHAEPRSRDDRQPPPHAAAPPARGVPHGASIRTVAVTDDGRAALSLDRDGGLRLWPTLDGTRAPVVVTLPSPPQQVALLAQGREVVAIARDEAGAVQLVRLDLDGKVLGRAQLSGGTSYAEIGVVGDRFLARTRDHALELHDASGKLLARLGVEHGERIVDLATRHAQAAAVIATQHGGELRWLRVADTLAWAPAQRLAFEPADDGLAIAPTKPRAVVLDAQHGRAQLVELATTPAVRDVKTIARPRQIGFITDDTLGATGTDTRWTQFGADAWAGESQVVAGTSAATAPAYGDGVLVMAAETSLVLARPGQTRYLGWRDVPEVRSSKGGLLERVEDNYLLSWIDENLEVQRTVDLMSLVLPDVPLPARPRIAPKTRISPPHPFMTGTALDEQHVLGHKIDKDGVTLLLIDTSKRADPIEIGKYSDLARVHYAHGMAGVHDGRKLERFRIDLTRNAVERLEPTLDLGRDPGALWVQTFDPDRAGGLVALVQHRVGLRELTLRTYRRVGARIVQSKPVATQSEILYAAADGTYYTRAAIADSSLLTVVRGDVTVHQLSVPANAALPVAIDAGGSRFAYSTTNQLVVVGFDGKEHWRSDTWQASPIGFVGNGRRLVVRAPGGIAAFDAASGRMIASSCGWGFGIHSTPPPPALSTFGGSSMCERPPAP